MWYFLILFLITYSEAHLSEGCDLLILGGGGSHGAYQAGVIAALIDRGYRWNTIKGYSAGSLNAAYLATCESPSDFNITREHWNDLRNSDIYAFDLPPHQSFAKSEPLKKTLAAIFVNRRKSQMNVGVVATSISTGQVRLFPLDFSKTDDLVLKLAASAAIPIFFPPVYYGDDAYWDGQMKDTEFITLNPCAAPLTSLTIIMTETLGKLQSIESQSMINLIERSISIMAETDVEDQILKYIHNIPVTLCRPSKSLETSFIDFSYGGKLWDLGYSRPECQRLTLH